MFVAGHPGQVLTFLEFPLDVFIHESFMTGPLPGVHSMEASGSPSPSPRRSNPSRLAVPSEAESVHRPTRPSGFDVGPRADSDLNPGPSLGLDCRPAAARGLGEASHRRAMQAPAHACRRPGASPSPLPRRPPLGTLCRPVFLPSEAGRWTHGAAAASPGRTCTAGTGPPARAPATPIPRS